VGICEVARETYGIDSSEEAVNFFLKQGIHNLYVGDVEKLQDFALSRVFEVVVCGELLEHLSNPGLALGGLKRFCRPDTVVIITVPNAFAIKGFLAVLGGGEVVHPDHVCYYSATTLSVLLSRHGYHVAPPLADGLIALCRVSH